MKRGVYKEPHQIRLSKSLLTRLNVKILRPTAILVDIIQTVTRHGIKSAAGTRYGNVIHVGCTFQSGSEICTQRAAPTKERANLRVIRILWTQEEVFDIR